MNKPKNGNELIKWSEANMPALFERSSPIQSKPATERMIKKNMRYIAKHEGLNKLWSNPDGQESILNAFGESLEHAAMMPEMGSIVPFGGTAEFVASVECYTHVLTTGKNAPFEDINIVLVHENDKTNITQNEGVFNVDMQIGFPRGEIRGVVVYATRKDTGKRIGEVYDVERLIKKAEKHSAGYKKYLSEKEDFTRMKAENKLEKDKNGNEYYVNKINKKDGTVWNKKVYVDDLTNPYDGPDRPEMLKKAAGKSFFRPYMKTRNAAAMADEWTGEDLEDETTIEKAADNVLEKASEQFVDVNLKEDEYGKLKDIKIVDAEIVEEKEEKKVDDINNL